MNKKTTPIIQAAKEEKLKQPKKSDKNWLTIFAVVITITIIVSIIYNMTSQKIVPINDNTWKFVTPGFKFTTDIRDKLGEPLEINDTKSGKEYNYSSQFPTHNNKVTTSEDNTVIFIEEYIVYNPQHTIDSYISTFGEPQLILNTPQISEFIKANVFLDNGVVVFAHITDGSVEIKWYFEPTTEEIFLKSWGKNLSTKERTPEIF